MCTIRMRDQFKVEFKRQFFLNNVLYEARCKLRELKQTGSIRDYVKEFTTLMLQIPNLNSDDFLFYFIDGLQNWAKQELQRRQVTDIDQAIVEAKSLMDFRNDKGKGKDSRGSNVKGGGDHAKSKETYQKCPKTQDANKSDLKRLNSRQSNAERKAQAEKKGCNICGGQHSFRNCPNLKCINAMVRE